jgi:rSAM/selenodomain-associated transferase 1
MMVSARSLLLFARLPVAGQVKTRLVPPYTPQEALQLHRALLSDSLDLLNRSASSASAASFLYLSESGVLDAELSGKLGLASLALQRGADLGERLARAFQERFAAGARQVVILGSDAPHLPAEQILRAFQSLGKDELVVGPARDGGYYLIGAARLHPELFRGIPWGTAQVYRETVRKARKEGISIASLPAWDDIDLPEAVAALWKEILHREKTGGGEVPHATDRLLRSWLREGKTF